MRLLVIGGTRNLGHLLGCSLLEEGHAVTVLNRGITPDQLPPAVERLHADRTDAHAMAAALGDRSWDAVIDLALYEGSEASAAVQCFGGRVGQFVFISTGQVYLVRTEVHRPSREEDAVGAVIPSPPAGSPDLPDWAYGIGKRDAEAVFEEAAERSGFPAVTLRLPMVHSSRDHYGRLHNYFLRLRDGGPLLLPEGPDLPVRHVWAADVVHAILLLLARGPRPGEVMNISQDETYTLEECLALLARVAGVELRVVRVPRPALMAEGLLPACSPFSGQWMSSLDNARSKERLGLEYTPAPGYLALLAAHYANPALSAPPRYAARPRELSLAARFAAPS